MAGGDASFGVVVSTECDEGDLTKSGLTGDVERTVEWSRPLAFGCFAFWNEDHLVGTGSERRLPWETVLAGRDHFLSRRADARDDTGDLKRSIADLDVVGVSN